MNMIPEKILNSAVAGIEYCETVSGLDDFLDYKFKRSEQEQYRTVVSILFNYFRNKSEIDYYIRDLAIGNVKPFLRRVISVALTQIFFQTGLPDHVIVDVAVDFVKNKKGKQQANFVNALIRRSVDFRKEVIAGNKALPLYVEKKLPELLYNRWKVDFSDILLRQICEAISWEPDFTFRTVDHDSEELLLKQIACEKVTGLQYLKKFTFYKSSDAGAVINSDLFADGKIYIQDPAAVMGGELLSNIEPGKILDVCSAPGGKTLMLAELFPDAEIIASDRSDRRLDRVRANVEKYKRSNVSIIHSDVLSNNFAKNSFDLILLDVPCSNTGVIRRRPDVMWNFTEDKFAEVILLQKQILQSSAELLKPGGKILYSTCSIEKEENSEQVSYFLKENAEFCLCEENLLLPSKYNDGAYAAVIRC